MRVLRNLLMREFSDTKCHFPRTAPQQLAVMVRQLLSLVNRDEFRQFVRFLSYKARNNDNTNDNLDTRALLFISWSIHPFEHIDVSKDQLGFMKVLHLLCHSKN
jgi:hypothetical protein